ncbi:MAG: carboxypeptidase M32 [Spirochaetales bacterium]|nr:carboxypeptidase M32 [Spirochaetales bacterium]
MDKEIVLLAHTGALLGWDQETYMPVKALQERSEQIALLQGMIHSKMTDPRCGELLNNLGATAATAMGNAGLAELDRAFIRELFRRYNRAVKIPQSLVVEMAKTTSIAQGVWINARKDSDFKLFQPHLEKIITLLKQVADCLGYKDSVYDPLLDEYEPWMTTKEVEQVFSSLKEPLVRLVQQIVASKQKPDETVLAAVFPEHKQLEFNLLVLKAMNFEFERGRLDVSAHPFTTTLGADDIRLTTRYNERFFPTALFGTIHECGHGLYELGFGQELKGTLLGNAASLGIHESQSRLWENMVGRSLAFWKGFFPQLKQFFPDTLKNVEYEQFYRAINAVKPSLVRVEADEVTYNLHIILRFELEKKLISGELKVQDLPQAWDQESKNLLGIEPDNHAQGCLQDIHWSMGAFGYFPTYTLGNLYAAQFFETLCKEQPELEQELEQGNLKPVRTWLLENIHSHGAVYPAGELCRRVTGEKLNPRFFIEYLQKKFGTLYDF